jgi:hypothetical protein
MNSSAATAKNPNNLAALLQQIGLRSLPAELDDFLARATKARWSPLQLLEQMVQGEIAERSRRSLERRLRLSGRTQRRWQNDDRAERLPRSRAGWLFGGVPLRRRSA